MEIERKYLDANLDETRKYLAKLGKISSREHFESNVILDTPGGELFKSGRLLRLRSMRWPGETISILTFKSTPAELSAYSAANVKAREEVETVVDNVDGMLAILGGLGYGIVGGYEKFREDWRMGEDCTISLDILPFGNVVEVEAPLEKQERMAHALGLDNLKTSINSYYDIYRERLSEKADPLHMMFSSRDRKAHMQRLGISYSPCQIPIHS